MQLECFCRFSLSPRGDGNLPDNVYVLANLWIFFIPARGRKRVSPAQIYYTPRFSLSPRGDGNPLIVRILIHDNPIFFIPARGRKRGSHDQMRHRYRFSLSPRGDGNHGVSPVTTTFSGFPLSPRGDGNDDFACVHIVVQIFFIPARGRKQYARPFLS